jgi:hypothetical protein
VVRFPKGYVPASKTVPFVCEWTESEESFRETLEHAYNDAMALAESARKRGPFKPESPPRVSVGDDTVVPVPPASPQ